MPTKSQTKKLIETLAARFASNMVRHPELRWEQVEQTLATTPVLLTSLYDMEHTGGEPDLLTLSGAANCYAFVDCSQESPAGRRSLCFDEAALVARKTNKPTGSVLGIASSMGAELLTEEEYRYLQTLGEFDLKTSSWIATPASIRQLDGALFCDRRYGQVFTYHNGVQSYYASRGFRCKVSIRL